MRRTNLPLAIVLSALLGLLVAAPASAATTGTLCGQVTAFTAPTGLVGGDGSITIDGTLEVIDTSAAIDAATLTVLTAVAAIDATTCLEVTAVAGDIVAIAIAAQAEVCGDVTLDTVTGIYSVAGVALPLALVSADADLLAILQAAVAADATVCVDVTISTTTGLITTIGLNATIQVCGDVMLDVDSATVGAIDVPLTLLDAEAIAVLELAADAGVDACVSLVVDDSTLVEANVSASVDVCGAVTMDAEGNATVGTSTIDAALLDAEAAALLRLAAEADGTACASVDASSTGGNTSVGVTVVIEVCADVTAITDGTITIGGVTFVFAGAGDAGIEVGDEVCVAATTSPTGNPVITDIDTTDETPAASPAPGGSGGGGTARTLPDTATRSNASGMATFGAMLLVAAFGLGVRRRLAVTAR